MKELQVFTGNVLAELKETLPTMPVTKKNYVLAVNLKSLTNSKAFTDWLAVGFAHVSECKDCEEIHEDGFGIKLVSQTKKIYKQTKDVKAAEKKIEELNNALKIAKKELELAQEKAGFTEEQGLTYYKAI